MDSNGKTLKNPTVLLTKIRCTIPKLRNCILHLSNFVDLSEVAPCADYNQFIIFNVSKL